MRELDRPMAKRDEMLRFKVRLYPAADRQQSILLVTALGDYAVKSEWCNKPHTVGSLVSRLAPWPPHFQKLSLGGY
jgi:hypothetical protein